MRFAIASLLVLVGITNAHGQPTGLKAPPGFEVPASSLTETDGHPAVWVVDPQSKTVSPAGVESFRLTKTVAWPGVV